MVFRDREARRSLSAAAEHDHEPSHAERFWIHNFIRVPIFQEAVQMDTRFELQRVAAGDRWIERKSPPSPLS